MQAVAARDVKKAEAYAKKHKIPEVFASYQELVDSPTVDAVYIPLPNGLHLEWAVKAVRAGKHVLLEKPAVANAEEAEVLFREVGLRGEGEGGKQVVVLEAFHYRFQPSWRLFLSLLEPGNVAHVETNLVIPNLFPPDDIRFKYDLAGGALMDLTYGLSVVRGVYGTEPEECVACEVKTMPPPYDERCDYAYDAQWRFPGGATARTRATLRGGWGEMLRTMLPVAVTHRGVVVEEGNGTETVRTRKVTIINFMMGAIWHRIDVEDEFVVRRKEGEEEVKRWTVKESRKAYTWKEADIGVEKPSEPYWLTYKHQLDAFVDRVKGREGTGAWVDGKDSIGQMRMIDMAYTKSGLPLRETSKFRTGGS